MMALRYQRSSLLMRMEIAIDEPADVMVDSRRSLLSAAPTCVPRTVVRPALPRELTPCRNSSGWGVDQSARRAEAGDLGAPAAQRIADTAHGRGGSRRGTGYTQRSLF